MKRRDWILVACLLLISAAGYCIQFITQAPAEVARISVGAREVQSMRLGQDQHYLGDGSRGAFEVEVKYGGIRMLNSDCPDQTCVRQGQIRSAGQSIICLPNQVSITLLGDERDGLDAVAY